ncbi:MAG: FAD-dependent thymidylate synthase, partial [Candidatus Nanohalobium sp.]
MTEFSEREEKALENFVTSAEDDIYAVKNMRPEIFGAFGSFFSRSPKDVRDHLLDAIKGEVRGHEIEGGEERLEKLANTTDKSSEGESFEHPQEALEAGLEKAQSFFEKYYGTYGHKSIANTVWIPFVANDVSQLFARKLADDQLAFFIEQSTRYVEFDKENYYRDPDVMDSEYADTYTDTIEKMTENYERFAEIA